ncbi:hypothetical protein LIER_15355 [Lithospermum erythrorhizon]|uniref:Uncharacterized protein n=1 Tax=Lithospermum erythrorhizon TaxID=34254 RepID=A0AAV3Q443_LITER
MCHGDLHPHVSKNVLSSSENDTSAASDPAAAVTMAVGPATHQTPVAAAPNTAAAAAVSTISNRKFL